MAFDQPADPEERPEQRPEPSPDTRPEVATIDPAAFAALQRRVDLLERQLEALLSPAAVQAPTPTLLAPPPPAFTPKPPPPRSSLETRLGSQVASRVGIIALLAGTAWFLKWAIDNQWLGPAERVLVGLLAGAALILWSERFRRKGFAPFSFALKAVGAGALYLSLWAAFQLYHLLPAAAALFAMILVTAWNAWMAWAQDAELLGGYALLGGLATPLLLSTGGDHEIFLFTYLAAIDLAAVLLVRAKPWPRLLLLPLAATAAYFIAWYVHFFHGAAAASASSQLPITLTFLALFFAIFAAASQAGTGTLPNRSESLITPVFIPFANALFVALALYSVLEDSGHHDALAWVAVLLAALYLGLMRLHRNETTIAVHLSLAVVFLTLAIPLKLSRRFTTLGWLLEGAGLLWTAARLQHSSAGNSAFRALRLLAVAALAFGFIDLTSLPYRLESPILQAFFNLRFATALAGILTLGVAALIAHRASTANPDPLWPRIALAAGIALNLAALQAGVTEILTYWHLGDGTQQRLASDLSISGFLMAYGAVLLAVGFLRRAAALRWQALLLLGVTVAKVFFYDVNGLSQGYRVASFLALGILLLGVSFAYQRNLLGLRDDPKPATPPASRP